MSNVDFQRSTDGGRTFTSIVTPHGDSHDLWIAPDDRDRMIEGNDGGANVSRNRGKSWTNQQYATAQWYHVSTTNHFPYRVCGAQQDNSALCGPSRFPSGIPLGEWKDAGGCESGYVVSRPDDPDIVYAGCYGGIVTRTDLRTGLSRNITVWPVNPMGQSASDLRYRFQWTFPILVSPHDPSTLYVGGNHVFRSQDDGESWEAISPDLTRHDPSTLGPSGGPITKDQTSVEYYATVFTLAESPKERGVLWAGSDDGFIHVSRDAGATWTNVTPKDLAPFTRVSLIEASPHKPGTAFVAANRYQLDDLRPYLWRTDDYGASWRRIDAGIAPTQFARAVREDPERADLLYAGTERGVWVSFDGGTSWRPLQRNLPPVPVHDLAVKGGDLIAATHGRSFWILDDLSALRQHEAGVGDKAAHLYRPRDAHRIQWASFVDEGQGPLGANPPSGATIWYWLKQPRQTVQMELLDSAGNVLQRFTSEPDSLTIADSLRVEARIDSLGQLGVTRDAAEERVKEIVAEEDRSRETPVRRRQPRIPNKPGLNRFVWDLRAADATDFDGLVLWFANTRGPVVPPGRYALRMSAVGQTFTEPFAVLKDPRTTATPAELAEQYALLSAIRDRTSMAHDAVKTIRGLRQQLEARQAGLGPRGGGVARAAGPLLARLADIERIIYQVKNRSSQDPLNYPIQLNNKIAALGPTVASTEAKPTAQSYEAFRILSAQLEVELQHLSQLLERALPPLNAELRKVGAQPLVP